MPKSRPNRPRHSDQHRPADHRADPRRGQDPDPRGDADPDRVGARAADEADDREHDADGHQHAADDRAAAQRSPHGRRVGPHRRDRRDLAGAPGRQEGGDQRHPDADGVADDDRLRRRASGRRRRCRARRRGRARPGRAPAASPSPMPTVAASADMTSASISTDCVTWRREAPRARSSAELAAALGDQDREGVDDDEAADDHRDDREHQQERRDHVEELADRRPADSLTTLSPVTASKPSGATVVAAAASCSWETPSAAVRETS